MSTRDRILDAAMGLFAQHGFKGTSITAIETAAGLSPGAGGIYRHFPSKQSLLQAGIDRHLDRLRALSDIRAAIGDLGDLRIELTLLARYALNEFDREADLLRVILAESRARPELVGSAVDQLVGASLTGFSAWLADRAGIGAERSEAVATVALGALVSPRLLRLTLGRPVSDLTDEVFVTAWVDMVIGQIVDS